jgi:hypothetical protein
VRDCSGGFEEQADDKREQEMMMLKRFLAEKKKAVGLRRSTNAPLCGHFT